MYGDISRSCVIHSNNLSYPFEGPMFWLERINCLFVLYIMHFYEIFLYYFKKASRTIRI